MTELERLNVRLVKEFDRYVLEHPRFGARIPMGAEILLQLRGNRRFNEWARELVARNHEDGRPVLMVTIDHLKPARSRIVSPRLRRVRAA